MSCGERLMQQVCERESHRWAGVGVTRSVSVVCHSVTSWYVAVSRVAHVPRRPVARQRACHYQVLLPVASQHHTATPCSNVYGCVFWSAVWWRTEQLRVWCHSMRRRVRSAALRQGHEQVSLLSSPRRQALPAAVMGCLSYDEAYGDMPCLVRSAARGVATWQCQAVRRELGRVGATAGHVPRRGGQQLAAPRRPCPKRSP